LNKDETESRINGFLWRSICWLRGIVVELWSMLNRFDTIPERDGQKDRQTDGQTVFLYQYRSAVCWRVINIYSAYPYWLIYATGWSKIKYPNAKIAIHVSI